MLSTALHMLPLGKTKENQVTFFTCTACKQYW